MSRTLPINLDDLVHCRVVESVRVEFKASWDPKTTGPQVLKTIWVRLFCDDLTGGEAACEGAGIHSVRRMLRTAIEWRDARVTEALAAT